MNWLDSQFVYDVVDDTFNTALETMFGVFGQVLNTFWVPVQVAAAIYIALIGYSVMTGAISMSGRDVAIRLFKVVTIIFLVRTFSIFGDNLFNSAWSIPNNIADFFALQLAPILQLPGIDAIPGLSSAASGIETLDSLATLYSGLSSLVSSQVAEAHSESFTWGFGSWVIAMAPLAVTLVAIYVAKFVAALLFLVSPIVFIISLLMGFGSNNTVLLSWFKALVMTFLTVILVYIVGVVCLSMMARYMAALLIYDVAGGVVSGVAEFFGISGILGQKYTLVHLAPLGVFAMFTIVLISQATSFAGAIMGVAGISTQQATSFMQIGALQAAR